MSDSSNSGAVGCHGSFVRSEKKRYFIRFVFGNLSKSACCATEWPLALLLLLCHFHCLLSFLWLSRQWKLFGEHARCTLAMLYSVVVVAL